MKAPVDEALAKDLEEAGITVVVEEASLSPTDLACCGSQFGSHILPLHGRSASLGPRSKQADAEVGLDMVEQLGQADAEVGLDMVEQLGQMRAIIASRALRGIGRMLRSDEPVFRFSRFVDKIGDFWSYSRHAKTLANVFNLLMYYNVLPSAAAGVLTSLLLGLLMPLSWTRNFQIAGVAVMWASALVFLLLLTNWPSQRDVFLDKACISQDDEVMKRNGILSIGWFLRNSTNMIVLWDETYFTRLWCVFEMAAFLKLQELSRRGAINATSKRLKVLLASYGRVTASMFVGALFYLTAARPMDMGPQAVTPSVRKLLVSNAVAGCGAFALFAAVTSGVGRRLQATSEQMRNLDNFSIREAQCHCCQSNHVCPKTGKAIACDRVMIEKSIVDWFGQLSIFDMYVRSEIRLHVPPNIYLPYQIIAIFTQPFLWDAIGATTWLVRAGRTDEALMILVDRLLLIYQVLPIGCSVCFIVIAQFYSPDSKLSRCRWRAACSAMINGLMWFVLLVAFRCGPTMLGLPGYLIATGPLGLLMGLTFRDSWRAW